MDNKKNIRFTVDVIIRSEISFRYLSLLYELCFVFAYFLKVKIRKNIKRRFVRINIEYRLCSPPCLIILYPVININNSEHNT